MLLLKLMHHCPVLQAAELRLLSPALQSSDNRRNRLERKPLKTPPLVAWLPAGVSSNSSFSCKSRSSAWVSTSWDPVGRSNFGYFCNERVQLLIQISLIELCLQIRKSKSSCVFRSERARSERPTVVSSSVVLLNTGSPSFLAIHTTGACLFEQKDLKQGETSAFTQVIFSIFFSHSATKSEGGAAHLFIPNRDDQV